MKIIDCISAEKTNDGQGVNISRVSDFSGVRLDPFLMIDELRSGTPENYLGGFPEHPHRGIETFTYMLDGAFEHRDHLGNTKKIGPGSVQWMSTGFGVVHSEMPVIEESNSIHGFQLWLNMPAHDKMRPAIYQDSGGIELEKAENAGGATLTALAGHWVFSNQRIRSPLDRLAQEAAIADLVIPPHGTATIDPGQSERVVLMLYQGEVKTPQISSPKCLIVDPSTPIRIDAANIELRALVLKAKRLREPVAHWGPFVMNTQDEIKQAISDYRSGKLGRIPDK